jgi:hypothetical protein
VQSLTTFDYSRAVSPFLYPLSDPQDDALFSIRFAGYYKPTVSHEILTWKLSGIDFFLGRSYKFSRCFLTFGRLKVFTHFQWMLAPQTATSTSFITSILMASWQ